MSQKMRIAEAMLLLAAVALSVGAAGCHRSKASNESLLAPPRAASASASGVWFPEARASFAEISESVMFVVARSETTDLIAIDVPSFNPRNGKPLGRYTWLIPIPVGAPLNQAIEVPLDAQEGARMIEYIAGDKAHSTRASGRVVIQSRNADTLVATVNVVAERPPPGPEGYAYPAVSLDRRFTLERGDVQTPQPPPPSPSDATSPKKKKK